MRSRSAECSWGESRGTGLACWSATTTSHAGARIAIWRGIEEGDTNVVVIGHGAWQSVFQGDAGVLGKKLVLRGHTYEIIGVASREFAGLENRAPILGADRAAAGFPIGEDRIAVGIVARLGEGVSKARAEAALASVAARAAPGLRPKLESRATAVGFHPLMLFFFGPVILALGLVLATCCANVANMLLARGLARQREIGIGSRWERAAAGWCVNC